MMGVPPPSSSQPGASSGGPQGPDKGRLKKEFHLPKAKEKKEGEKEKKNLFELSKKEKEKEKEKEAIAGGPEALIKQEQSLGEVIKVKETQELSGIEAKQAVSKIAELIKRMVAEMQVGTLGGKEYAQMQLKATEDVPSFFANSTLTLNQTGEGLVIRFTNFETPQQQALAIQAVEQQKNQLTQLMTNLQTKNIAIAQLQIGDTTIALPKIEPLPPPFKVSPPPSPQTETESERRQRQREEGEAGPQAPK